jgi:hypothetical protein
MSQCRCLRHRRRRPEQPARLGVPPAREHGRDRGQRSRELVVSRPRLDQQHVEHDGARPAVRDRFHEPSQRPPRPRPRPERGHRSLVHYHGCHDLRRRRRCQPKECIADRQVDPTRDTSGGEQQNDQTTRERAGETKSL